MSKSRLQHAALNGFHIADLNITLEKYADLICKHSFEPERVVELLRVHGVPWDNMVCRYAACYNRLHLLQWLHMNDCQWNERNVLYNASTSGSVTMLDWLLTVTAPWTDSTKLELLERAAWFDKLAAVQWLRARGAAWPTKFTGQYSSRRTKGTVKECWSLSAVQWAVASGSGWLDWHCDDYAEANYTRVDAKQHAADVLMWAHANGCPCTCDQQQQ
jgi:hypothetical protein